MTRYLLFALLAGVLLSACGAPAADLQPSDTVLVFSSPT